MDYCTKTFSAMRFIIRFIHQQTIFVERKFIFMKQANILIKLAEELRCMDYNDLAKDLLSKAIELAPGDANVYTLRGNILIDLEKYDEAIDDFTTAIKLDDKCAEAYCNRGHCNNDNPDEAIADFTRAIELAPEHAELYRNRGIEQYKLANMDKAIEDFEMALTILRNHHDEDEYISNLCLAYGQDKNEFKSELLSICGRICVEREDYKKAKIYYRHALDTNPKNIHAFASMAEISEAQ